MQRLKTRLLAFESRMNGLTKSKAARRWLLPIGLIAFVVITVLSFASLSGGVQLHWWAMVIVLLLTPVFVTINTAEYRLIAEMNEQRVGWLSASRLTVAATAANMLPLPGGVMIRTQALRIGGSSYKNALMANAVAMLGWLGVGAVVIGALFLPDAALRWAGVAFALVGLAVLAVTFVLVRGMRLPSARSMMLRLTGVEVLKVAISGVRIYFTFEMIGFTATPAQAVGLTAANILSSAIGIFPGGLGLREALAGLIGAAMSLSLAVSVAVMAANRIVSQVGLLLIIGPLMLAGRWRRPAAADEPADPDDESSNSAEQETLQ